MVHSTRPIRTASVSIARAEALFVSDVSAATSLSRDEAADAIRRAVRAHHGTKGCAAELAAAYGHHPEIAAPRMRWARETVDRLFATQCAGTETR